MTPLSLAVGPLALFAFVASITPGPNNLLLMRSGASFGIQRSLRPLFGVQLGFAALVLLSHLGVGALLLALPAAFVALRWACAAYLLWLAWLILRDSNPRTGATEQAVARPMRLVEAMLFQPLNPKAWMMATTVASAFYGDHAPSGTDLAVATAICLCIGGPCMLIWVTWGASIDHLLRRPGPRQAFNVVMALLVVATAVWMLYT